MNGVGTIGASLGLAAAAAAAETAFPPVASAPTFLCFFFGGSCCRSQGSAPPPPVVGWSTALVVAPPNDTFRLPLPPPLGSGAGGGGSAPVAPGACKKTHLFSQLSLCLSRACLGKIIIFIYKWLRKNVLLPVRRISSKSPAETCVFFSAFRMFVPSLSRQIFGF